MNYKDEVKRPGNGPEVMNVFGTKGPAFHWQNGQKPYDYYFFNVIITIIKKIR